MYKKNGFNGKLFEYCFQKAPWFMYVGFEADIRSFDSYAKKRECIKIANGLWARAIDTQYGNREEFFLLQAQKGLKLISDKILNRSALKNDTLILFHNFRWDDCYF